jgi:hypothetical protein
MNSGKELSTVTHACSASCVGGVNGRIMVHSNSSPDKSMRPYPKKKKKKKRTGGVAQVVEYLHNKPEVLSSNSSTAKKKKTNKTIVTICGVLA